MRKYPERAALDQVSYTGVLTQEAYHESALLIASGRVELLQTHLLIDTSRSFRAWIVRATYLCDFSI
jgi:hypothetical protein